MVCVHFRERGKGHIVGIGSLAGIRGFKESAYYSASKAAQMTFLESLRVDLRRFGIKVTTVLPGFVDTPINDSLKKKYKLPFLITAEDAATRILIAAAKNKRVKGFPLPAAYLGWFGRWISPRLFDFIMGLDTFRSEKNPQSFRKQVGSSN